MPNFSFQHAWSGPHGFLGVRQVGYTGSQLLPPLFVDPGHAAATDLGNDGQDQRVPLATLARALVLAADYQTIYVLSNLTESVTSATNAAANPQYINIIGASDTPHGITWASGGAALNCLTLRAEGWTIQGFTFECPSAAAGIRLEEVPATVWSAYKTKIIDCIFDGLWAGLYGINFVGAPHRVKILGCQFIELRTGAGTAYAIMVSDTTNASPYEGEVIDCLFWENENHVGGLGGIRGFNLTVFRGNIFHEGELIAATQMLDLRGGSRGNNIVVDNKFCGDYSQPGGYWAHAGDPGMWVGNYAEDVVEPEVADNGITIAPPAA